MPIYEFHCGSCGDDFEELVPLGTSSAECPSCGGNDVSRRVSVFGFSVGGGSGQGGGSSSSCSGCSSSSCSGCGSAA